MASIPAFYYVNVVPSVLSAGGTAQDLNGLILTTNTRVPIGQVLSLSGTTAVQSFFGPTSDEAAKAAVYFQGFDNSNKKPGALLFSQYPIAPVAAYIQGINLSGMSLTTLKALSGTMTVTIDGVVKTSTAISLTAATSFSNAATIMLAAFTTPGFTLVFDAVSSSFIATSSTTGAASTAIAATGTSTLAAGIGFTAATGVTLSQGAIAATPAGAMIAITAQTTNWACFMTLFEPVLADKLAFALWTTTNAIDFVYVCWDTDATAAQANTTSSFGYLVNASSYSGIVPIYLDPLKAAFVLGTAASIDFTQTEGRITFEFKGQSGLSPDVTDPTVRANLKANGYSFYVAAATANQRFLFLDGASVSGQFKWLDSYVNQIWLNNQIQLANMVYLTQVKRVPYNLAGRTALEQVARDPILQAVNCGVIVAGVTLSASQISQVNSAAGMNIADTLFNVGWYYQVKDTLPQVRAARGSPPITLWYCDGGAVHSLNISSVMVL